MMKANSKPLWRNRTFLTVWGGQSVSMFGSRVSYIAWMWWIWEQTGSTAATAGIGIAAAIPNLLLGPIAGAIVDQHDRRRVLAAMDLVNAVLYGMAATLLLVGLLCVWHVYAVIAMTAVAMAFHRPALQSSIPNLVSKGQLTRGNSLYVVSRGICGLLGLLVGGILVGAIGVGPTLWLDAATFVIAGLSLLLVRFASPRQPMGEVGWRRLIQDTVSGFRFLYRRKSLFTLILLFALVNFLMAPLSVLFPIMSDHIFNAGARGLSVLSAAVSGGFLIGGLLMAILKRVRRQGVGILLGLLLVGSMLALFGVSKHLALSTGILVLLGTAVAAVNVFESVIFQSRVPNALQGRVFAAQFAICEGLQPISLAIIGVLLTVVSTSTVLIGSGIAIILASIGSFAVKGMTRL